MTSSNVLRKFRTQLVQYLSYDEIKHHLFSLKLLTHNEYQRLDMLQKNATDYELVEKVLELVMRKGPNHETVFIQALRQSLEQSSSIHLGNQELLPLLQRELDLQQSHKLSLLIGHSQNQGNKVEKDGIYLFPESPDEEQPGLLNLGHSHAILQGRSGSDMQGRSGSDMQGLAPPVCSSVQQNGTSYVAFNDTTSVHGTYAGFHPYGSPVLQPRAVGNTSAYDSTPVTRPLFQSSPDTRVTESFNSMSLHSTAIRGKLEARSAMTLGDFSVAQDVQQTYQDTEELKCRIVKESKAIMRKYATLVLQVYRLLQKPAVCFEEVRLALIMLGCSQSKPGSDPSSSPLFSEPSEIVKAKSIPELVTSLHSYSSWFNYDLIKFLAEQFGGDEGVELIAAYEDELRGFFNKFIFECPQFASLSTPEGFSEMEMKVDWEYRNCKTQDVAIFKTTVTELLGIAPRALRLKSVEEGCVLLTWMVPSSLLPHVALCLSKKSVLEELARENLQSVTFAGKFFDVPTHPRLLANVSPIPRDPQQSPSHPHKYSDLKRRNSFDYFDGHTDSVTATVSSLSDMTGCSSPCHDSSAVSIGGSYTSKRALSNRFSDASVEEFFSETNSIKEAEILSLYSGERSPTNTINRYSKRNSKRSSRDSSLIQESLSPSHQLQDLTTSEFAPSDNDLHHVASRLSSSMLENRRKSETDIAHLKSMAWSKRKEKKKPKLGKYHSSMQRLVSFSKRRVLRRHSRTPRSSSSTMIVTATSLCSHLSSPTDCNQSLCIPQCLPLLELSSEPLPASHGKPHYYNFLGGLSPEPLSEDSKRKVENRDDGTSVASLEWQPLMSDLSSTIIADTSKERSGMDLSYNYSPGHSSQEMAGSQEKTIVPVLTHTFNASNVVCQEEVGVSHSQPCPSSSSQPWKSFSHSPSSDEIHAYSTQSRIQGHTSVESDCPNFHQRSQSVSICTTSRMQRTSFGDDCAHISRVSSPCCSVNSYQTSSGYCSRRSSDYSLSQTDGVTINQLYVPEEQDEDCCYGRFLSVEGQQRPRSGSVRRHNSLSYRSRNQVNHDLSPLARNRSSSMHK